MGFVITTATKKILALKKRIKIIQGGTSASKTISVLLILIDKAQVKHEKKELISIVSESVPHLKRGVMRDFKIIMQSHGYWNDDSWSLTDSIYTFETGNQIEFFSTDNGDKLRGARRDWLFMNEANNNTFEAFEQLEVRTTKGIYLDYNPTNEFWVHTELKGKRDDVDFIILTYKDNEALDQKIVDSLEQRKNRKDWWTVYGLGQLGVIEGRIYKNWEVIDEVPHEARIERTGIDFGYYADPTVIIDIYYWNGAYIWDEVLYQKALVENKKIADVLSSKDPKALAKADRSESRSVDEIKSYGVMIMPSKGGPGSVLSGISFIQSQKIFVTKRSVNLIKEYRNYLWKVDKDGKVLNVPEHTYSHSMDAGRYGMEDLYLETRSDDNERADRLLNRLKNLTPQAR